VTSFLPLHGPGLLHTLTSRLQSLSNYTPSQSLALHNAYYCGYIIGPLSSYYIFSRVGFKATFITGLGVFTVACLSFWPSSSLLSFPGFVISNLLIGCGLAILQLPANPFIALAGPDELMESRLNFSQGLQAVGAVIAPLLANKALFRTVTRAALFRSQWVYLGVSLWASLLGIIIYYVPLSEASDDDLEHVARQHENQRGLRNQTKVWRINIVPFVAVAGILAMWLYLGTQQHLRFFWGDIMGEVTPG
jgi:fucose permease